MFAPLVHALLVLTPAAVPVAAPSPAALGATWDESSDGDLSTDPAAPTPVVLVPGTNTILGSVVSPGDTRDYITFTIPPGQSLTALRQRAYVDIPGGFGANRGYNALNSGSTSLVPDNMNGASFLGGNHVDPLPAGSDMLPGLAAATLAGTGFSLPLGPGTYCYLIQQTGPEQNGYELEFEIEAVTIPAMPLGGLLALGAVLVALAAWSLARRQPARA